MSDRSTDARALAEEGMPLLLEEEGKRMEGEGEEEGSGEGGGEEEDGGRRSSAAAAASSRSAAATFLWELGGSLEVVELVVKEGFLAVAPWTRVKKSEAEESLCVWRSQLLCLRCPRREEGETTTEAVPSEAEEAYPNLPPPPPPKGKPCLLLLRECCCCRCSSSSSLVGSNNSLLVGSSSPLAAARSSSSVD